MNAALPHASVVVPVYNGQTTIDACIRSLRALDYPRERLELIVVDNASTDATADVLARHSGAVRVVGESTRGPAAARNAGIRAANGEVIAFTDADCIVDSGWLRHLVVALGAREDLVVGGTIRSAGPANAVELFGERVHDHRQSLEVEWPPYAITMSCAARASLVRDRPFDQSLLRGEDVDHSWRLFRAGASFAFVPEAVIYHRNERTLAGVFREGWRHGFYAVPLRAMHMAMVRAFGLPKRQWRTYASGLAAAARRDGPAAPETAFMAGKLVGDACGTVWRRLRSP